MLEVRARSEIDGTYQFGAESGELDGRLEKHPDGRLRLRSTFEGEAEFDPVHGYGEATLVGENILKDTCAIIGGYISLHLETRLGLEWTISQSA